MHYGMRLKSNNPSAPASCPVLLPLFLPPLQAALADLAARGQAVPLVLFGHMHDSLKGGGRRNMAAVDPATGTVYVNCAVVPRIKEVLLPPGFAAPAGFADGGAAAGNGVTSGGSGVAAGGVAAGAGTVRSPKRGWQEAQAAMDGAAGHHSKQQRGAGGGSSSGAAPLAAAAAHTVHGQSAEQQQQQAERRIRAHHFVVVELQGGALTSAKNMWVGVTAHDRSSTGSSSSSGGVQQGGASAAGAAGNRERLCVPLWEEGLVQLQKWSEDGRGPGGGGHTQGFPGSSNGDSSSAGSSRAYAVYQAHEGAWRTVVVSGMEARPAERGQQQRIEK